MKGKNCPNCGAVYTLENIKCPYCGTLYFDMTAIDFTENKPIFIRYKIPYDKEKNILGHGKDVAYLTQCAIPKLDTIDVHSEYKHITDGVGNIVYRTCAEMSATINVHFDVIPYGKGKQLFEIKL